jgi:hypothetical protein
VRFVLAAQSGPGAGPCEPAAVDAPPGFALRDSFAWLTGGPNGGPGDTDAATFRAATDEMGKRLAARPATGLSSFLEHPGPGP